MHFTCTFHAGYLHNMLESAALDDALWTLGTVLQSRGAPTHS
jgi:hypothetical protein